MIAAAGVVYSSIEGSCQIAGPDFNFSVDVNNATYVSIGKQ